MSQNNIMTTPDLVVRITFVLAWVCILVGCRIASQSVCVKTESHFPEETHSISTEYRAKW